MIIGIDARMLGPECGGLGRYIEQLVLHLFAIDQKNQYILFLTKKNLDHVNTEHVPNVRKVLADIPWYGWREQVFFPALIKKQNIDLMHFPHWNVPLMYNAPFVVTIHDLLLLHYPTREASLLGPISYWFKQQAYHRVLRHAAHAAARIIAPSEFTKQDILRTLNIPPEKISVTYEAPFETKKMFNTDTEISLSDMFGIQKPYALYVGVAYPHKNLKGLLDAWYAMKEKYGDDGQLVLVGKDNYFYKKIKAYHRLRMNTSSVIFTGFVSDEVLTTLYTQAKIFVFPSLYEGFGLPPLEAMAQGIPVVSSNRTCLPEILGEAALYTDPENVQQFAETMHQVLVNEDLRFELKMRGKEEIKRYSWKKMADETLEIFCGILRA